MSSRRGLAVASFAVLLASGCGVSMPHSGPVEQTTTSASPSDDEAVNINPRRPGAGDSPEEIVRGFLEAMTATPAIKTSVAREFLTPEAQESWQPTETIIYTTMTAVRSGSLVEGIFTAAARTDARGAWLGPLSEDESTIPFPMEQLENDEWRISEPPNALIVPQSWFEQRFQQVSLYFFDTSATLLVPEPVFVPLGRQFASTLVNGLLAGPSTELADTELSFLPPQLRSLGGVTVSTSGVAQVDLTSDTAPADPMPATTEAELLVSQLAWTLRQDPSISRFKVTIGGRQVQLPNGETEFSVGHGVGHAPYVAGANSSLYGLLDGKLVGGSPQNLQPVTGPFGEPDYGLRAVATDIRADRVAGVTESGTSLLVAPVAASDEPVLPLISDGADLLDPAWDFRDRLWEVDRRPEGSVVQYLQGDRMRVLDVPGISGADVKAFLVSRDGSRLVAVLRTDGQNDAIVVSRILTSGNGRVVGALPAVDVTTPDDLDGQIRDIAWRSPTSIIVLHPMSRSLFQVRSATVDGAPVGADGVSITLDQEVLGLVGTPVPEQSGYALISVPSAGEGSASQMALVDLAGPRASSIDIGPGVTSVDYAG